MRPFALALFAVALLAALALSGGSAAAQEPPLPNAHEPYAGEPFFLLSDATYGSADQALVRLEVNSPAQLEPVGGVDILVYRIPEPLAFLQRQRNLHRVRLDGVPAGQGLANTLTHVWDNWVVKARLAWQQLFSGQARRAVTQQAPALKTPADLKAPSTFGEPRQFRPLPGLTVVERFRYPVQHARPIAPPEGVRLAGSSSHFIAPSEGNVFIPVGRREPGLYLVEAIAGQHRATTLLFVSDTVAVTKVSGEQMLVWAAHRVRGSAVPRTRVVWSDGVGVLKSGSTDAQGLLRLERRGPEQSYVFGEDPAGGVFISENFYYDSEIHAAKVYAYTDRPLYRPGDTVHVKVLAREFRNARDSVALKDGEMTLVALDPAGQPVTAQTLRFSGASGADTRFLLPDNAPAGGYELRLGLHGDSHGAAFRVADYQKPHFEILLLPDKPDFKVGDKVAGRLQLAYPDGKPVAHARISLSARTQPLTMVEGELDYGGAFALKLQQDELLTDAQGIARFSLPAAERPSRYILSALATDGAAYRVRSSREILVERGSASLRLVPERQFSRPGESVGFAVSASRRDASPDAARAVRWEWVRLEDRAREEGAMPAAGGRLALTFPQPGSYTVTLRDAQQRIVAATSHWVSGTGMKAPAGSIGIVFDRASYRAGDSAEALVTFPEPVEQALVTLERDRVEVATLLAGAGEGFSAERLNPTQWRLRMRVREEMSPNITLSLAYVKDGDYVFQNQGLRVEQPRIALSFSTPREVYAPGETVQVELLAQLDGRPVAAEVSVGVVDEMIYVLQPEIAPGIDDFFFHPRRNNVRTHASLSFIGYDLATRRLGELPQRSQVNERAVKVLERPRRDNVDTAAWLPALRTGADGRARFSFVMPDSLTRWRLTARAIEPGGRVGQHSAWLRSDKLFYAKWTSPDWQREGDRAQASVALFNQTGEERSVEWEARAPGIERRETVKLRPGANFVSLPLAAERAGALNLALTLRQDGRVVDRLETPLRRLPVAWRAPREQVLDLSGGPVKLELPPDATRLRVTLAQDPAAGAFSRWIDELADFPYGCVEQTASRMLPLAIALQSLSAAQQPLAPMLAQRLAGARQALMQMAGPQARFGWWGRDMAPDAFLTAYAYYADWRATQALKLTLPDAHWQRLLEVYAKDGGGLTPLQRALALSWMQEMGLPVGSMLGALLEELAARPGGSAAPAQAGSRASLVMVERVEEGDAPHARDLALVLAAHSAGAARGGAPDAAQRAEAEAAAARLAGQDEPLAQALLLLVQRGGPERAAELLRRVGGEQPGIDRAQALLWIQRALGGRPELRAGAAALPAPWQRGTSAGGQPVWQWPAGVALPQALALAGDAKAAFAFVSYESVAAQEATLPVRIERRLWRVVPLAKPKAAGGPAGGSGGAGAGRVAVKLEAVEPGTPLDSNTLYLDQITLASERALRWALLEVALPPGAAVESGTWGIDIAAEGDAARSTPLERAQHQDIAQGYAVPLEALPAGKELTLRHLVRFSQRGEFRLPPARVWRMYAPEAKAVDGSGRWAAMEVR